MPKFKITVKLTGEDGNAFFILGRVTRAMKNAGIKKEAIEEFIKEATGGDYNHLLQICMKYVVVE